MKITVKINNVQGLVDAFQKAEDGTKRNMVRAMRVSMNLIQQHARAHHRFTTRSGNAERSVETEVVSEQPMLGRIFLDTGVAHYAPFLHAGTAPHEIVAREPGKLLRYIKDGQWHYIDRVMHPGTRPDEFLYQAADAQQMAINDRFNQAVEQSIREAGL